MTTKKDRILIIEDDADVRRFLIRFAGVLGWEAAGASSGPEALGLFKVGHFSLVLSDINLNAAMDGIEAVRKLRESEPRLRVVMMSGDCTYADRVKEAGLGALLPKPIDPGTLAALLERHRAHRDEDSAPGKPNCVLLVEDEPAVRELLSHYINKAGWEVVAVEDAVEAMRIFEADKFHLLLADVLLPHGMDGIELARRLKALQQDLRIVMISGAPGVADRVKAANLGPFLSKPLDLPALTALL
jgi:DNA-binding response OmpR family regulator